MIQAPQQVKEPPAFIVRVPHECVRRSLEGRQKAIADWCTENGVVATWHGCRTSLRGIHWHYWRVADEHQAMMLCLAHGDKMTVLEPNWSL